MHPSPWARARAVAVNLSLVLASPLVCLAAGEGYLRLFHPVYEYAAESRYDLDHRRIYARRAHSISTRPHPDTGVRHTVIHNNLALRQHRDFSEDDLTAAVSIGVFGDSYTENLRLPGPYSFTEVLDYLLLPEKDRDRFNVLNFGVSGYGTDQSFLHYEDFRHSSELDVVFYLFCRNDLRNIYENGLFHPDETGKLTRNPAIERAPWVSLLSGFHMTYLVIDGARRLASLAGKGKEVEDVVGGFLKAGEDIKAELAEEQDARRHTDEAHAVQVDAVDGRADSERTKEMVVVFQSLLRAWQQVAQERGGRFVVVVLPRPQEDRMAALIPSEIETVNLFECFNEYDYRKDSRFANDGHWNEQGNMLAAVCLYRFLERELNLSVRSTDGLREQLHRYYAAFQDGGRPDNRTSPASMRPRDPADIDGLPEQLPPTFQTWMPPEEWIRPTSVQPWELAAIRSKYRAVEMSLMRSLDVARLVARSTFALYLGEDRLTYARASCTPTDTEAMFFLHIYPTDVSNLPDTRRRYGFDNLDFRFGHQSMTLGEICVTSVRLPRYDIARIRTGQFIAGEGEIWHEEFAIGAGRAPNAERAVPTTGSPGQAS